MDRARASRLVAQAAETSRLLGVDFVPVYTSRDRPPGAEPEPAAAAAPADAARAPTRAPAHATIEPKPASTLFQSAAPAPGAGTKRDRATNQRLLDALRARYEKDAPHDQFVTAHNTIVFGEGDPCARLMFVGEAPGAEEDRTGRPFVGRAGQLLDKMIAAMGLKREQVYIGNVLKTRPPDNATPTFEEIRLCAPYLFEQIGIIGPEVIVTLGLPATRALLNSTDSMSRLRGRWATFVPPAPYAVQIPVMPTYHPAFLLRSYTEQNRKLVWSDLRMVMDRLGLAARSGTAPD